jgi:AraC-like DNA-binding protein
MLPGVQYVELAPGPALRGRALFWRLTDPGPAREARIEPVLPDGRVELIVHLGDPFEIERDERRELQARALLAGPGTAPVRLAPTGRVDVIGVRFEAGVAAELVGVPMAELVDRVPELDAVARDLARGLGEELADPPAGERWNDVLERRLACALERPRIARAPELQHAIARARASGGRALVVELARAANLSPRQLERRFRERVGVGPKTYLRLVRFQRALALLRRPEPTLGEVAARCGYFDQAHLVRDFRRFAHESPGRFRAARYELAELFAGS